MASFLHNDTAAIKNDPDVGGQDLVDNANEEDIYEDTGDLDLSHASEAVYLTRLPKFLWKTWLEQDDDTEVQIGTIRVEGALDKPQRMSLMLSEIPINETVPHEYNMQITNSNSTNTFIFTEQDLPGYSHRGRRAIPRPGDVSQPFSQAAPKVPYSDRQKPGSSRPDKGWRRGPNYRRGVPKKTALAGQVQKEINCLPVENEQYRQVMDERARSELKPKRETQYIGKGGTGGNSLNPGTLGQPGSFNTFIRPTGNQRAKAQESKAARMPQNELLDLIYECFKKFNYWPLKSLKNELNQPEAYLRQTLEMVAQLVRTGPHAMTWQLKPEAKLSDYAGAQSSFDQAQDQAPDTVAAYDGASETGNGGSDDDGSGNTKMEDVIL